MTLETADIRAVWCRLNAIEALLELPDLSAERLAAIVQIVRDARFALEDDLS